VIDESDLHPQKQDDPRISTLVRIKIDSSDENANASDSIRVKCFSSVNFINHDYSGTELVCDFPKKLGEL
jgi:hypothetical protein